MSYRGLKWHKFKFVLTPAEFDGLFSDLEYFIAVTNRRVEEDYKIADKTSIFSQYKSFYKKIISGEEWQGDDHKLDIYTALTDNPKHVKYESFQREEDGETKTFKRALQKEPAINISPFALQIDHKEKLTVSLHDSKRHSNIGLELSYPKEIVYLKTQEVITTEHLSTYKLYHTLEARIKDVAKKAKAKRNAVLSQPNFWISPQCIRNINKNVMIKRNAIVLS